MSAAVRSIHIAVHGALLHLAGVGGFNGIVTPCAPIAPLGVGVDLVVGGVLLGVDIGDEPPFGVRASRIRGLVAHVVGVAGVVIGIGGIVVGVEGGVAAGGAFHRVVGIGIAPVVVQVAGMAVGINHNLLGVGFGSGNLGLGVLVVQAAGGGEAGGGNIRCVDHGACGAVIPSASDQLVAAEGCAGGGGGDLIGVAVLLLGLDQIFGNAGGLGGRPRGVQDLSVGIVGVTADGAGVAHTRVGLAGFGQDGGFVAVAGGDGLGFHVAAVGAGVGFGAILGAGSGLGGGPGAVGMAQLGSEAGVHVAAVGAGGDRCAVGGAGSGLDDGGISVAVRASALVSGRVDDHEILVHQVHRAGNGGQCGSIGGVVVGVLGVDGIGVPADGQGIEGSIVVDGAVVQGVGLAGHGVAVTGDRGGVGAEAFVNIDGSISQTAVLGTDGAVDNENIARHMSVGSGSAGGQGNIVVQILHVCTLAGVDIAGVTGFGNDFVPQVTVGIAVQSGGFVNVTCIAAFNHDAFIVGADAARQRIGLGAHGHFDPAVGRVVSTGAKVAFLIFRHAEIQVRDVSGAHKNAEAVRAAIVVGVAFYGGDVVAVGFHHQAHVGPASGEEQVTALGRVVVALKIGVSIAVIRQGAGAGVEIDIKTPSSATCCRRPLQDGGGDSGLLSTP